MTTAAGCDIGGVEPRNDDDGKDKSPTGLDCGDKPELPYVCPDGNPPDCTCVDQGDGTAKWVCGECAEVDCTTNPDDAVCKADAACINCHGLKSSQSSTGIENSHPWSYVGCVDCHGGVGRDAANPDRRLTKEESHVPMPPEMAETGSTSQPKQTSYKNHYLGRAGVEEMTGGLEWIQVMNPGDLRINDQTCSKSGCHVGMGDKVLKSTMSTLVGKYDAMLYLAGVPRATVTGDKKLGTSSAHKRMATYGTVAVQDPDWDPVTSPPGSVPELVPLTTRNRETDLTYGNFDEFDILEETINKLCGDCHLNNNGGNEKYGKFRSAGCSGCHMPYAYSGRSESSDPRRRSSTATWLTPPRPRPTSARTGRTSTVRSS